MTDLKKLQISKDAVEMFLHNPLNGEKMDIGLLVVGKDSEEFEEKAHFLHQSALKKAPQGNLDKLSRQDDKDYILKLKAAHIKGFIGEWEENGEKIEFSENEAKNILVKYPWIREQLDKFVDDRVNFIKG